MSTTDYAPARPRDIAGPEPEQIVLAAFLSGYREPTRSHHASHLKAYFAWC